MTDVKHRPIPSAAFGPKAVSHFVLEIHAPGGPFVRSFGKDSSEAMKALALATREAFYRKGFVDRIYLWFGDKILASADSCLITKLAKAESESEIAAFGRLLGSPKGVDLTKLEKPKTVSLASLGLG